tara:strand:- start:386 stop:544 length:159 start_codon:yes stop_codon:yes gene_type:complete
MEVLVVQTVMAVAARIKMLAQELAVKEMMGGADIQMPLNTMVEVVEEKLPLE